jgi:hypothetical protein
MVRVWSRIDNCTLIVTDAIATAVSILFILFLVIWLEGCATAGQFNLEDASKATPTDAIIEAQAIAAGAFTDLSKTMPVASLVPQC